MIQYRSGYKYQLTSDYSVQVEAIPFAAVCDEFICLDAEGMLTIKAGYAWDGPSGPTFDTTSFMRGSLVHDALYQLISEGLIPDFYRDYADRTLYRLCREDGMSSVRAWYVLKAVQAFGEAHTKEAIPVQVAP